MNTVDNIKKIISYDHNKIITNGALLYYLST